MNRIFLISLSHRCRNAGMSIVGIVIMMLFMSLAVVITASLVGTGSIGTAHVAQSAQAFAIAHAGAEWYMEQLQIDLDWTDQANDLNNAFANGEFDITIGSNTATEVAFTSTGRVASPEGVDVERRMSMNAQQLPRAFLFALYYGRDVGTLSIRNSSTITGDMWTIGDVSFLTGSTLTGGTCYYADTESVSPGSIPQKAVSTPYLTMPIITETGYTTIMNGYDTVIDAASGAGDVVQSTNLVLTGNTIQARDFDTTNNITISGNGRIVAYQDLNLHDNVNATLTVSPSGGNIEFLAGRDLIIGRNNVNTTVTVNTESGGSGVAVFYARALTNTNQQVQIIGANTTIHGAQHYARRRITCTNNATADEDSLFYIDSASSTSNNYMDFNGCTVDGSLISVGRNSINMRIRGNSSVTGLVYSYDAGGNPSILLNGCTITGSVVASQYRAGRITNCNVTYDATALPDTPPGGFLRYIIVEPNSWDGV